jgi:hypothetical protein
MEFRAPHWGDEFLNRVSLSGLSETGRATKFSLGNLTKFRGQSVDDVLKISIEEYLTKQSFNNTSDLSGAIENSGLTVNQNIRNHYPLLEQMISRRHQIVHNADRNLNSSSISYNSISLGKVRKWKNAVDDFSVEIIIQLRTI